jgi:small subunit ribosomal protein S20
MPHHKSAAKRVLTNEKSRQRNVAAMSRLRSSLKAVRAARTRAEATSLYTTAASLLDRTVAKGIIRRGTADRHKSRLATFTAKLPA